MTTSNIKLGNSYCCVYGCYSKKAKNPNLRFHTFPKEKSSYVYVTYENGVEKKVDRKRVWEMILLMKRSVSHQRVCSFHFQPTDYYFPDPSSKKSKLCNHAVPTLNLPQTNSRGRPIGHSETPTFCAVRGCNNQSDKQRNKQFFPLPSSSNPSEMNNQRRYLWMKILGVCKMPINKSKIQAVCSDHFVRGFPSNDKNHPDYVPSMKIGKKSDVEIEKVNVDNNLAVPDRPDWTKSKETPQDPLSFDTLDNEIQRPLKSPEFVSVEMEHYDLIKEEPTDIGEVTEDNTTSFFEDIIKIEPVDFQEFVDVKSETDNVFYYTQDHTYCK